jgi:tetratricopeptide (TPR) repeat protein
MSESDKHLEAAEKYRQRGKNEAALREYLQVLLTVPDHEVAGPAAADLHRSLGHDREAADLLGEIFDRQVARGQNHAAVVTYRKLLKVTTPPPRSTFLVARFLERSSPREALELYQDAMCAFMAAGRKPDAYEALECIVRLEATPNDLCQLGELAVELQHSQRAASAFAQAAGLLPVEEQYESRVLELCQRAYALDPGNAEYAIAYGRVLLGPDNSGDAAKVVELLQPFSQGPAATPESRALYGRALLAAGRPQEAAPFLWQLFQRDPQQVDYVFRVIGQLLESQQTAEAVALARRLEQYRQSAGELRELAATMQRLASGRPTSIDFLEYMAELFNAASREAEYCEALLQLFELHFAGGNFLRASECLDRAVEIDPYVPGLSRRLEMLQGKIEDRRLQGIADRLRGAGRSEASAEEDPSPPPVEVAHGEPTVLEDLLLQAEIFLQYSLPSRAAERLARVRKLFPEEELSNEKLRGLCARAGIALPAASSALSAAHASVPASSPGTDIARITEIARNLGRQSSARSILLTAVNEAGRHWKATRAIAVLCTPGKPPSMALEYCAPGKQASDVRTIVKLIGFLQPLLVAHGPLVDSGPGTSPSLLSLRHFAAGSGIGSILTVPLIEGDDHIGLLLLAHADDTPWQEADTSSLKTLADQVVLSLSHSRLRRILKSLAITEASGLLKRSSYLEVLLAEVRRAASRQTGVTAVLLNFGVPGEPDFGLPGLGEASNLAGQTRQAAIESRFHQIGQLICTHVRQNDVAIRYDPTTIALVLPATEEQDALGAVEKLRAVLGTLGFSDRVGAPIVAAGIAQAVRQPGFEPEDIVTELINRVEEALGRALHDSARRVHTLAPPLPPPLPGA